MEAIKCENCGSQQFVKDKSHYTCLYCKSVQINKRYKSRSLIILIILMLFMILLSSLIYFKLSSKDEIVEETISSSQEIMSNNPFAQTIFRVEETMGKPLAIQSLETAIKQYYNLENPKAFYLGVDKSGKYIYGYSTGKSNQKAKNKALALCKVSLEEYKEISECFLYLLNDKISMKIIN